MNKIKIGDTVRIKSLAHSNITQVDIDGEAYRVDTMNEVFNISADGTKVYFKNHPYFYHIDDVEFVSRPMPVELTPFEKAIGEHIFALKSLYGNNTLGFKNNTITKIDLNVFGNNVHVYVINCKFPIKTIINGYKGVPVSRIIVCKPDTDIQFVGIAELAVNGTTSLYSKLFSSAHVKNMTIKTRDIQVVESTSKIIAESLEDAKQSESADYLFECKIGQEFDGFDITNDDGIVRFNGTDGFVKSIEYSYYDSEKRVLLTNSYFKAKHLLKKIITTYGTFSHQVLMTRKNELISQLSNSLYGKDINELESLRDIILQGESK